MARYEHAPRHVIEARYLHDYKVWLEFNDGRKGVVDLADELHGEELEPLRDRERFATFYLVVFAVVRLDAAGKLGEGFQHPLAIDQITAKSCCKQLRVDAISAKFDEDTIQ